MEAYIRIWQSEQERIVYEDFFISDGTGRSIDIPLFAPCVEESLCEDGENMPYAIYHVEVRKKGYQTQRIYDIAIFANTHSTLQIVMLPIYGDDMDECLTTHIPTHQLRDHDVGTRFTSPPAPTVKGVKTSMLSEVIIPTNITVHLGRPDRNAENLTVPFIYYLKNVASSEIYPTWPYEALKANIWAQISLVLNRVFTEWYPSQGYNFDITNSTAFDQAFVKNRNIYDNIAAVVDEVFNEYIQKRNFAEPFYAEYCDGKIAQCPGMKQWGTLDLANRGFDALSILRYYYGDQIRIVSSDNIQPIRLSYPGTPFRLGDSGPQVAMLQAQLNAIAINYPNIKPIFPVNGVFGPSTEAAVRVFQRQFNLGVDGIVGKATYYKISFVFVAVRKLAELGTLGYLNTLYSGAWQGIVLREGDRGIETQLMQYWLSSIAQFYPEIPSVSIDGRFGAGTENAVLAFQRRFNLTADGLVGQTTWERIYVVYTSIADELPPVDNIPPYPGFTLQLGSIGDEVAALQNALMTVSAQYTDIPIVNADGIFGNRTRDAILTFQRIFGLNIDGVVGPETWALIFETAADIRSGGSSNADTAEVDVVQNQLNMVAQYYPDIPDIPVTRVYDDATQNALRSFQQMMGMPVNGDMDAWTLDILNQTYNELTA